MHKEIPGPTPDADRISTSRVWSPKVIEGTDAHGPRQRREDERYSRKASDIIRSAADLEHQVFAPIRYFVAGYIAEGCTILAGAPKLGKSWLALEIALAIATGGTCLGGISCEQGDVLYLALEDNERRIKSRVGKVLRSMHGADAAWPSRFNYVSLDKKFPHAGDGGLAMIEQWLQSAKAPRAVVIDVLQKFRAPSRGNKEGQYEADYRAVGELQALAAKYQVAIIVVHHVRKAPGEGDPFERISGTNGISGAADTAIVMVRDGRGTTIYARGRDIEEVENAVEFNKGDCVWVVLGAAADIRKSDERRELLASLKEAGEPKKPSEVAAALGRKVSTITNLLAKMASSGEVVKAGYGKYAHPDVAISAYVRSRAGE
jgi:hypothetical protein